MTKLRIKWNSDKILSLSAMSISFITLIIFIYQTNLMSKQNALSILPYLQMATSDNPAANAFSLSLKNHGVGPAIIESVNLEYKGKKYDLKDYNDYLFNVLITISPELDSIKSLDTSTLDRGIAIPANSNYLVFSVFDSKEDYDLLTRELNTFIREGLRFEIIYKSIQDERWVIHDDSEGPIKLD
ncbi:MAG: hypothetical protein ABF293_12775 [Flavobacteriaceae bacterium]